MEKKNYSAKTLDEAITKACIDLGVPSDRLEYTVTQNGTNGFFGLGAKPFIIEAAAKPEGGEKKAQARENKQSKPAERSERPERKDNKRNFRENSENRQDGTEAAVKAGDGQNAGSETKTDAAGNQELGNGTESGAADSQQGRNYGRRDRKDYRDRKDRNYKDREPYQKRDRRYDRNSSDYKQGRDTDSANGSRPYGDRASNDRPHSERPRSERHYNEPRIPADGDEAIKRANEFLSSLFKSMEMNIEFKCDFKQETNELSINLSGDDMGVLIGKRGQTLDALQYLTGQVVNKHQNAYVRVKMDSENYRERRKESMEQMAQSVAAKVKRTKRPVALEPMNPYERRVIHSVLQGDKEIVTRSEGEEPYRHVVVCPVKKRGSRSSSRYADNMAANGTATGNEAAGESSSETVSEAVNGSIVSDASVRITESVSEAADGAVTVNAEERISTYTKITGSAVMNAEAELPDGEVKVASSVSGVEAGLPEEGAESGSPMDETKQVSPSGEVTAEPAGEPAAGEAADNA